VRVLIATDGSPHSERAVALVAAQAWPPDSVFRVIVIDDGWVRTPEALAGTPVVVDADDYASKDLTSVASSAARVLDRPGWTTTAEVLQGRAASVIVEEGDRFAAEVLVVGSRGRGPLGSLALGSVSAEVVDHAGRPVIVARGDGPIRRVVLGDDGSDPAIRARRAVAEWEVFADSEATVTCVAHVPAPLHSAIAPTLLRAALADYRRSLEAARTARDRACEAATAALQAAGRRVSPQPREGDPAHELLAVARESEADLVVVGSRGQTGLTRLLLGSVARNVLYEAPCSVLVVR
jgi:nucleotide-binding universal stress UspA family protein